MRFPDSARSSATLSGYQAERRDQPARAAGTATVLPEVERMRIERAGTQRWLVVQEPPEKLWPVVKDFWQESGFLIKMENAEAGVMETDWAETRAQVPDGTVRNLLGRVFDSAALDLRARQVPHAPRPRARRAGHRDLHQPPRHGGALHHARADREHAGADRVAAARAGPGARGRVPAPADGAPRRPGGAGEAAHRERSRRSSARTSSRATTAPSGCRCTSLSTAPGAASASRSTASASPSRTATGRRACTSCATPIPRPRWARRRRACSAASPTGSRTIRR